MTSNALVSVIDNDESVRDSTVSLLRSADYAVAAFESGEEFLESGRLSETGCLILDVRMPGMNGLELQCHLNIVQSRVPIIFVTAHNNVANRRLAIDGGAFDFFEKPVAAVVLLGSIEMALKNGQTPEDVIKNAGMAVER